MYITESGAEPVRNYFSSGSKADLTEIKKTMEKEIIRNIMAPLLLSQKDNLQRKYDTLFTDIASGIKESIQTAADQIDDSMKGQFSKKVANTLKDTGKKYDNI